jgi:hypothetical protein
MFCEYHKWWSFASISIPIILFFVFVLRAPAISSSPLCPKTRFFLVNWIKLMNEWINEWMYVCMCGWFRKYGEYFPLKSKITWIYTTKNNTKFPNFFVEKIDKNLLKKKISDPNWFSGWAEEKKNIFQVWNDGVTVDSVILDGCFLGFLLGFSSLVNHGG